jgi:ribosomal-protein-alanine N-acetyltransferase
VEGALERFETDRLAAERAGPEHLEFLVALHADPRVMATLGGLRSAERTAADLNAYLEHWQRYGFGVWLLLERATGKLVGRGALRHVEIEGHDEVEVGYAIAAERWGRGLATEIARELVRIAFDDLGLEELVCFTLPTNAASRRVMEKAGFVYDHDFEYAGFLHALYRQRRATRGR